MTHTAAVFTSDLGAQTSVPPLRTEYRKLGGRLAADITLTPGQCSYRSEVAQVVQSHPDSLISEMDPQSSTVGPVGRWAVRRLSGLLVYVVVCAAPPAARVGDFVALADRRDWEVAVVASPDALPFLDPAGLERATGHPVRSSWRRPDEPASVPDADAVVVAPATFNTLNKWVAGIADTVATATVSEYLGRSVPMVVAPCVNPDLSRHPTFQYNLQVLAGWDVTVLFDDAAPRAERMAPWERIAEELERAIAVRASVDSRASEERR
jgi:hypothetical protein